MRVGAIIIARRYSYRYAKAGVVYLDLSKPEQLPASFFPSRDPERSAKLMAALDAVNGRYGRDALRPGATRQVSAWGMRRGRLSPRYTTHIDEMLEAKA